MLTLFISRRCSYKLQARVKQGVRMWTSHPLALIRAWYHAPQPNEEGRAHIQLTPKRFSLPSTLRRFLAEFGLHPDTHQSSTSSAARLLSYTVSQDTAKPWTNILGQVLDTMLDSYCPSAAWTSERQTALWQALVVLSRILTSGILEHMITSDLAEHLGEKRRQGKQSFSLLKGTVFLASGCSQLQPLLIHCLIV